MEFDISATPAGSKINIIIYLLSLNEYFIEKRYKTITGEVITTWSDQTGETVSKPKGGLQGYKTINII